MEFLILALSFLGVFAILAVTLYKSVTHKIEQKTEDIKQEFRASESLPYNNVNDIHDSQYFVDKFTRSFATSSTVVKQNSNSVLRQFLELLPNSEIFSGFGNQIIKENYYTPNGEKKLTSAKGAQIDLGYRGRMIIEGQIGDHSPIWMQINWETVNLDAVEGLTDYAELIEQHPYIKRIQSVYLVFPKALSPQIKLETLRQLLAQSTVPFKLPIYEHKPYIYNVVKRGENYFSKPQTVPLEAVIPEGAINLFYNPAEPRVGDRFYKVPMTDYINLCYGWLLKSDPVSCAFYGFAGTGKTKLTEQLAWMVADNKDCRLIVGNKKLLDIIDEPEFKMYSERVFSPKLRNVILFDEAEELFLDKHYKATLKSLLSGPLQRSLNCAAIIAFNGEPEDYDPALFREGRCITIDVTPIKEDRERITAIVEHIAAMSEIEYPFNNDRYTALRDQVRKDKDGNITCPKGYITLGDIFASFQPDFAAMAEELAKSLQADLEPKLKVGQVVNLKAKKHKNKKG